MKLICTRQTNNNTNQYYITEEFVYLLKYVCVFYQAINIYIKYDFRFEKQFRDSLRQLHSSFINTLNGTREHYTQIHDWEHKHVLIFMYSHVDIGICILLYIYTRVNIDIIYYTYIYYNDAFMVSKSTLFRRHRQTRALMRYASI